jgi:hypothetical protein
MPLDVVGIRVGSNLADALAAVARHDPGMALPVETLREVHKRGGRVELTHRPGARAGQIATDRIGLDLLARDSSETVYAVARIVRFKPGQEPSIAKVFDALANKYGRHFVGPRSFDPNQRLAPRLIWHFDSSGQPLERKAPCHEAANPASRPLYFGPVQRSGYGPADELDRIAQQCERYVAAEIAPTAIGTVAGIAVVAVDERARRAAFEALAVPAGPSRSAARPQDPRRKLEEQQVQSTCRESTKDAGPATAASAWPRCYLDQYLQRGWTTPAAVDRCRAVARQPANAVDRMVFDGAAAPQPRALEARDWESIVRWTGEMTRYCLAYVQGTEQRWSSDGCVIDLAAEYLGIAREQLQRCATADAGCIARPLGILPPKPG